VLKVYRHPAAAGVDAHVLRLVHDAHAEHYRPPARKGSIQDVTIDGAPASSLFTELVPGLSLVHLMETTPRGPERAAHLAMLNTTVKRAAVMYADLHTSTETGRDLSDRRKQNDAQMILGKVDSAHHRNDQLHFTDSSRIEAIKAELRDHVVPAFLNNPLPASAFHGDAHPGNVQVDRRLDVRPIDLTSMYWSFDAAGGGTGTGAVDVGQFIARLHEMGTGSLTTAEIDKLQRTFLDEYFRHSHVSEARMRSAMRLYAVETQLARIEYGLGDPNDALDKIDKLLGTAHE
jgi:hypothetical protein